MTTKPDQTTRRQHLQRVGGVTLTALGGTTFAATNSASADGDTQGILADGFEVEPRYRAFISGYTSRYSGFGRPEEVETLADRARNEFNANADHWVSYANWLLEEADVVGSGAVTVGVDVEITSWRWPTRDEQVATTIEVGYDDTTDEFESLEWTNDEADDPDFEIGLVDHAAENAADELSAFRREWIDESGDDHELPDDEYLNELGGAYAGTVLFGSDAKSVLELLLGEVDVDVF